MFRHGVTVNVLSNNVATLYGHSGVREDEQFKFRFFLFDFLIFLFSDFNLNAIFSLFLFKLSLFEQGSFKNRIGYSRVNDVQLNSGLHSVCNSFYSFYIIIDFFCIEQ